MLAQMFDLDGHVVAELRKFAMHRFNNRKRVRRAVEKIRIAEGDVLRARGHLLANILQHHVALHHAKRAVVHRHDRAMPAQMLAAASCFGRTRDALLAAGHHHARIFRKFRHPRAVGHKEFLPRERNDGLVLRRRVQIVAPPYPRSRAARLTSPSSNSPPRIVPTPSPRRYPSFTGAYRP